MTKKTESTETKRGNSNLIKQEGNTQQQGAIQER
jgi:hypothetical protein